MIIQSTVVGISFRPASAKEAMKSLKIGDYLFLEAEPSNPYDSNAVKVIDPTSREFIGYLSRDSNLETSEHLRAEGDYTCTIVGFFSTMKPTVEIDLIEDEDDGEDDAA